MFELAITLEVMIAPYFWAFLWSHFYTPETTVIDTWNIILCHSVSFVVLVFEFTLINAVPILLRHFSVILGVLVVYMMVNMAVTLSSGKVVYPGITWDSTSGILIPVGILVFGFVLFFLLTCCSKLKMKRID